MPEAIVLDASAWVAVLLNEKNSEPLANLLESHTLIAPELIRYEAANAILFYAKKVGHIPELLEIVRDFPIHSIPVSAWWDESIKIARRHEITFYDASYLGIAKILNLPVLTLDQKILKVMKSEKLETAI